MHLRIDSIEQALRDAGWHAGPMDDAGYRGLCGRGVLLLLR
jgi:hypothetical protein